MGGRSWEEEGGEVGGEEGNGGDEEETFSHKNLA